FFDDAAQVGFDHAVKLDALARRDAQRIVAVKPGKFIENQPLLSGHNPPGNSPADHYDKLLPAGALVTIILLVATVELQKLVVIARELVGRAIGKRGRNSAGEERIGILNFLV